METPRERYHNDNHFHLLVDTMVDHIQQCNYTPSEMREAAILASILYEEHNLSVNSIVLNLYAEKNLEELDKFIKGELNGEKLRPEGNDFRGA